MAALLGGILLLAFAVTAACAPGVIRLAHRTGFLDRPGPAKVHQHPVAYGGGIAIAAGTLLPMAAGLLGAWGVQNGYGPGLPPEIASLAPGVLFRGPDLALLCGGGLVILVLGLVDDRRRLTPRFRLAVETLVASGFVAGGERLSLFAEGSSAGRVLGAVVTVLWIVGITNAFNLLDHMDGISAGVASIASGAFALVAWLTGQYFVAASLLALLGACLAFLCFNFPPARLFLGDGGSLFIGYMLATLTVTFTFYQKGVSPLHAYAMPLVVLAVPLFDTGVVVFTRLRQGRSVFLGDRNHLAHRLHALGLSARGAALGVYALTALTGLAALLLYAVRSAFSVAILLSQVVLTFALITLLEQAGRSREDSRRR